MNVYLSLWCVPSMYCVITPVRLSTPDVSIWLPCKVFKKMKFFIFVPFRPSSTLFLDTPFPTQNNVFLLFQKNKPSLKKRQETLEIQSSSGVVKDTRPVPLLLSIHHCYYVNIWKCFESWIVITGVKLWINIWRSFLILLEGKKSKKNKLDKNHMSGYIGGGHHRVHTERLPEISVIVTVMEALSSS